MFAFGYVILQIPKIGYESFINKIAILSAMGRIKTKLIKRVTIGLVRDHRNEFSTTFDKNKAAVTKFVNISSKKLRNTIAGYATRLMKHKEED